MTLLKPIADTTDKQVRKLTKDLGLTYIIKLFSAISVHVRQGSLPENVPVMKTIIKNREQACRIHLVLWCLNQETVNKINSGVLEKQTFESITVQGDFLMPSYQGLVPNLFMASVNLKLHGCSFKITSDLANDISTQLSHIRVLNLKEVKITGL